jgi:hypothetical protein
MRRILIGAAITLALLGGIGALGWFGTQAGWFGGTPSTGAIEGKAVPGDVIAARVARVRAAAPAKRARGVRSVGAALSVPLARLRERGRG